MSKYRVGDCVRKITGYPFVGVVCAAYEEEEKCCVKHADGWEHIFSDKQLSWDWPEYQYLDLVKDVLKNGDHREGRNGGVTSVFGRQIRFNLSEGFPLLTTKRVHTRSVFHELIWFLSGDTNTKYLKDNGVTIWDEWEDENGDLGPVYGKQWRQWEGPALFTNDRCWTTNKIIPDEGYYEPGVFIDQIANLIEGLKRDPYSRRHIVSAWHASFIDSMALPPCHCLFQFHVSKGRLNCQLYQRSADLGLGVPFNIASYALLVHMVANEIGLEPGEFVHTFGDLHIYDNHVEALTEQLTREPRPFPTIKLTPGKPVLEMTYDDITLLDYNPWPTIKMEVSA